MAIKPIILAELQQSMAIVDDQGRPSPVFLRFINGTIQSLKSGVNSLIELTAATAAAQAAADAAQDDAIEAASAAIAAQTSADGKIDQSFADTRYVRQDIGPAWTVATGTASRSAFATYSAPTISNPPTQAEVQAVADAVQILSQHMKALIDDLKANSALT